MFGKIEHLGIAVVDLKASELLYESLLGTGAYKRETVDSEGVNTLFFKAGSNKIELLESTHSDGTIAKFLSKNGEGIHHVAFEVADIKAEMSRLRDAGFILLSEEPRRGADNKWVAFVHPRSASGVLIELCQERMD